MRKTTAFLSIANRYGNVDVRRGVPKGYAHVPGKWLQPLCRKLGIKYAGALVGWGGGWRFPCPHVDGVIVAAESAKRLTQAIQARQARSLVKQRSTATNCLSVCSRTEGDCHVR